MVLVTQQRWSSRIRVGRLPALSLGFPWRAGNGGAVLVREDGLPVRLLQCCAAAKVSGVIGGARAMLGNGARGVGCLSMRVVSAAGHHCPCRLRGSCLRRLLHLWLPTILDDGRGLLRLWRTLNAGAGALLWQRLLPNCDAEAVTSSSVG